MIKFYLGDLSHEIHCNTNSTITEVAGAFDLGTMELEWNECKHAIFPNTPFYVKETTSNEIWNFIICEDNVEVVKKTNTVKYLHRLTLSQSVHKLNNVPLRNSVFAQPLKKTSRYDKSTYFIVPVYYDTDSPHTFDYIGFLKTDHNYNTNSYLASNYVIDLTNVNEIKSGVLNITSVMAQFSVTWGQSKYIGDLESRKFINERIKDLVVSIVNADNFDDPGNIVIRWYSTDDLYTPYQLTDEDLNWLKNKRVFIKIGNGSVDTTYLRDYVPAELNIQHGLAALFSGLIKAELVLNFEGGYSLWDVLNTLNEQCKKQYNGNSYNNFYLMPDKTTGKGLELDSIVAPEFSFTNCDLYEAVAQVLSYIDAFPTLKQDGTLDYQYLNNLSDDVISDLQISDEKTTLNETNFTNRLATYYQKGKINHSIIYPQIKTFKTPTTSRFGVPDKNDWYWVVEKPIDYIEKLYVLSPSGTNIDTPTLTFETELDYPIQYLDVKLSPISYSVNEKTPIDITKFVFENEIYGYLPSGFADATGTNSQNKFNSLKYTRGDNKIYLGETGKILNNNTEYDILEYVLQRAICYQYGFGLNQRLSSLPYTDNKFDYYFNCEYYPILDGKVSQESTSNKAEKETIVAQSNGNVDLNRLGNNLQGLVAKLGNEEKSITLPITEFKSKIKLGTRFVDELGNNWFANRIQTTFTTDSEKVIVNATFTKDYNALAQFTRLNQEKRFYEVNTELTTKGYENINEFVYFTNLSNDDIEETDIQQIAIRKNGLDAIIEGTLKDSVSSLYSYETCLTQTGLYTHGNSTIATYIQPIVFGCGNQLCIEMGFDNAINSTNRTLNATSPLNTESWLYTTQDGKANYVDIIGKLQIKGNWETTNAYPEITSQIMSGLEILDIKNFYYYKRENEIFHLNYSLNFLPNFVKTLDELGTPQCVYEEIYFGDKFINENNLIPNTMYQNGRKRKLYLYTSNEKYSIIDSKAFGTLYGEVSVRYTSSQLVANNNGYSTIGEIEFLDNGMPINISSYKSWCIADEDKNIYIAVNVNKNVNQNADLRFFTRRFRKV